MRNIILGFILGIGLTLSFNVSAAIESLIGKSIDNEFVVELNGKELSNKALAVEGSSYAPVRVISEALGLDVDFKNNKVILNAKQNAAAERPNSFIKQEGAMSEFIGSPSDPTPREKPISEKIKEIDNAIVIAKGNVWSMRMVIERDGEKNQNYQTYKDRLARYEAELADLEKQKAELLNKK